MSEWNSKEVFQCDIDCIADKVIILKKGEESSENEMREYGNAHMAKHKVPRYFVFVSEFPMNAAGKILKYKMREDAIEKIKNLK